ncbi:hypothetical protein KEJ47_09835 [Candidatus Bathyarchaeota archaeon]|nr:hypothetical protein [Candidatus Bathyarchaeota archaeon]
MKTFSNIKRLIQSHVQRRPLMRAVDVYKLLYQGVFGVGHILGEDAFERLKAEALRLNLNDYSDEPLLEDVSVDGSIVRVNLRPYISKGLPIESLYSAMVKSSAQGNAKEFRLLWNAFRELVDSKKLEFDLAEIADLDELTKFEDIPPVRHSNIYREAYKPSYRVVERRLIEAVINSRSIYLNQPQS